MNDTEIELQIEQTKLQRDRYNSERNIGIVVGVSIVFSILAFVGTLSLTTMLYNMDLNEKIANAKSCEELVTLQSDLSDAYTHQMEICQRNGNKLTELTPIKKKE